MTGAVTVDPARPARWPTPDLARGLMLLLIAVANVPYLLEPLAAATTLDRVWVVARTGLVDQRVYPVFAFFLGHGLAVQTRHGTRAELTRLRRRGLLLFVLGALHALLFSGDILGAYGVLILTLAAAVVGRRRVVLLSVAVVVTAATIVAGTQPAEQEHWGPAVEWGLITLGTPWLSLVLPAAVVGVLAADLDLIRQLPQWPAAPLVAAGGLVLGVLTSLPVGLQLAGFTSGPVPVWASLLATLGTMASVGGWIAACAVLARHRGAVALLGPLGRRSLSAYLAQSVLLTLVALTISTPTTAGAALLAAVAWIVLLVTAHALERAGLPGPAEALVRRLLALPPLTRKRITPSAAPPSPPAPSPRSRPHPPAAPSDATAAPPPPAP